jgi:hypothetical protein
MTKVFCITAKGPEVPNIRTITRGELSQIERALELASIAIERWATDTVLNAGTIGGSAVVHCREALNLIDRLKGQRTALVQDDVGEINVGELARLAGDYEKAHAHSRSCLGATGWHNTTGDLRLVAFALQYLSHNLANGQ